MIKHRLDLNTILPENPICAEVGVAEGQFSLDILKWPAGKLYMVDLWGKIENQRGDGNNNDEWHEKNYKSAMQRVSPYKDRVEVLRGISWEMAEHVEDESIDFLHLDACHSYECVKADLEAWVPKVKKGGIVSGHDFLMSHYGVQRAVLEFCKGKCQVHTIPENKPEDAGFYFIK